MSIFEDHITNHDDIVLQNYDYEFDVFDNSWVLRTKKSDFWSSGLNLTYVTAETLWKYYVHEDAVYGIKYIYGYNFKPTKKQFVEFCSKSTILYDRIVFKGQVFYQKRSLWEFFNTFNEFVVSEYMKQSFNNR